MSFLSAAIIFAIWIWIDIGNNRDRENHRREMEYEKEFLQSQIEEANEKINDLHERLVNRIPSAHHLGKLHCTWPDLASPTT